MLWRNDEVDQQYKIAGTFFIIMLGVGACVFVYAYNVIDNIDLEPDQIDDVQPSDPVDINSLNVPTEAIKKPKFKPGLEVELTSRENSKILSIRYKDVNKNLIVPSDQSVVMSDDGIIILNSGLTYCDGDREDDVRRMCKMAGVKPKSYYDYTAPYLRIIPLRDNDDLLSIPESEVLA